MLGAALQAAGSIYILEIPPSVLQTRRLSANEFRGKISKRRRKKGQKA
jgi:hypothetical protein